MKSKVPQKGLNYIEQQQIKRLYEIGRHREAAAPVPDSGSRGADCVNDMLHCVE